MSKRKSDPVALTIPAPPAVPMFGAASQFGTPVSGTMWVVTYQFKPPARKAKLPQAHRKNDEPIQGHVVLLSQDPTGGDAHDLARLLLLGENPYEGHDFRVMQINRGPDLLGFARLESMGTIAGAAKAATPDPESESEEQDPESPQGGSAPPSAALN